MWKVLVHSVITFGYGLKRDWQETVYFDNLYTFSSKFEH